MPKELYPETEGKVIRLLLPHLNDSVNVEEIRRILWELNRILAEDKGEKMKYCKKCGRPNNSPFSLCDICRGENNKRP